MHTEFKLGSLKLTDHTEDLGINKRLILKWILEERDVRVADY